MPFGLSRRLNDIRIWIRLVIAIVGSVAIIWAGFLAWASHQQKRQAIEQAQDFALSLHQMTLAGLTAMMINGTIGTRALFLDQIKQSNHVDALQVYRSEAVIRQFGKGREGEVPEDPDELRVLEEGRPFFAVIEDGHEKAHRAAGGAHRSHRHLRAILPALAEENYLGKNCLGCHEVAPGTVLGAVSMIISLDRAEQSSREFTVQSALTALSLLVPLGFFIWYFIARIVTRPLSKLTFGLNRIAEGDIEHASALPRRGADEIGQAAEAFNRVMAKAHDLIKQQRLSRIVFDNALEGITVTDDKARIQMVNRAFVETTGYSAQEAIGQTPALLRSGRHDATFYQAFWKALTEKGEWRGEIWNRRKNGSLYPEWLNVSAVRNARGDIEHFIAIFSDITERKQREEMITWQAYHDALTGLPNRMLFRDRLDQTLAMARRVKNRSPAVMFLDLDRFKQINDTLGHDAGDELLKEVAARLKRCVRDSDTVARLGGDEFTVLLPEVSDEVSVRIVADKILDLMQSPVLLAGTEVTVTTSVGIAIFPRDGRDADTLMKHADSAMYQVKAGGRAGARFFTEEMDGLPSRRLEMETRLREALTGDGLVLHYQPLISLATGRSYGAEALLRLRDDGGQLLLPEEFLAIAEESGLIVPIGDWVIETACAQAAAWRSAGRDWMVAVNLSSRQLHRMEIVDTVRAALSRHALPADRLQMEISETVAMRDGEYSARALAAIAHLGVRIVVDDFGLGYSNLQLLQRISVHGIKIDRAFIRSCEHADEDRRVVHGLAAMAHAIGLHVIAEGVETVAQRQLVDELGCDEAQGFLFGRPAPADQLR
jgi:diguanylate cyclase (GGDEF)-like protein/PAS domain S-box-containing protein